jgi:hypothetical protein
MSEFPTVNQAKIHPNNDRVKVYSMRGVPSSRQRVTPQVVGTARYCRSRFSSQ